MYFALNCFSIIQYKLNLNSSYITVILQEICICFLCLPTDLSLLMMFETIRSPCLQRREGASNSRYIPVGREGQPPQCKLTLVVGHISMGPEINAVILFLSGWRSQIEV